MMKKRDIWRKLLNHPAMACIKTKKERLKQGEMEPKFVGSWSAPPETWQRDGVNNVEFKTSSSYLRMGTPKLWGI